MSKDKDLDLDLDFNLDDILGDAIDEVAGKSVTENQNDKTQSDKSKDDSNEVDVLLDIVGDGEDENLSSDGLAAVLNEDPLVESDGDEVDVLLDIVGDGEDEDLSSDGLAAVLNEDPLGEPNGDEVDVLLDIVGDGEGEDLSSEDLAAVLNEDPLVESDGDEVDILLDIVGDGEGEDLSSDGLAAVLNEVPLNKSDNVDDDDLSFLDGEDGLVGGEDDLVGDEDDLVGGEIDVDELLGQAKGEISEVPDKKSTPSDDDLDPLSDFSDDSDEDDFAIEPEFEANDISVHDEELANIEPDIDDEFMSDSYEQEDQLSEFAEDSDGMVDISADEPVNKSDSTFKPHTEVEDVEGILNGGVSGIFGGSDEGVEQEKSVKEDVVADKEIEPENVDVELPPSKPVKETEEIKQKSDVLPSKGGFGVKAIVATSVLSVLFSLAVGGGVLHFYGNKIMSNTTYVDSNTFENRMDMLSEKMERQLLENKSSQASDVNGKFDELSGAVDNVVVFYDAEFKKIQEQQSIALNKQNVDKAEMEALNVKAMLLLNQFVDDTKSAQAKVAEEVYAKVVKVVRDEFSNRDSTVKLDEVLSQVSALKSGQTEIKNRVQTQMNLIGVLENEGDFLSKRMATLEVGGTSKKVSGSDKPTLKTGYGESDSWGYLEVSAGNGEPSVGRFKYGDVSKSAPVESSKPPYVLNGVFMTGSLKKPEYKVYVTPRASKSSTPVGYSVGQQIPSMGKILRVEATSGNEKVPYVVHTEFGILKGEQ